MSVEKAVSYYKNKTGPVKMNCGQAVLAAFKDRFSLEDGIIMEFSSYGSGKAPDGECGAFHAAKRILGSGCAEKIKECEAFFADKAGATKCKEIRKLRKITCVGCVETASSFI